MPNLWYRMNSSVLSPSMTSYSSIFIIIKRTYFFSTVPRDVNWALLGIFVVNGTDFLFAKLVFAFWSVYLVFGALIAVDVIAEIQGYLKLRVWLLNADRANLFLFCLFHFGKRITALGDFLKYWSTLFTAWLALKVTITYIRLILFSYFELFFTFQLKVHLMWIWVLSAKWYSAPKKLSQNFNKQSRLIVYIIW